MATTGAGKESLLTSTEADCSRPKKLVTVKDNVKEDKLRGMAWKGRVTRCWLLNPPPGASLAVSNTEDILDNNPFPPSADAIAVVDDADQVKVIRLPPDPPEPDASKPRSSQRPTLDDVAARLAGGMEKDEGGPPTTRVCARLVSELGRVEERTRSGRRVKTSPGTTVACAPNVTLRKVPDASNAHE